MCPYDSGDSFRAAVCDQNGFSGRSMAWVGTRLFGRKAEPFEMFLISVYGRHDPDLEMRRELACVMDQAKEIKEPVKTFSELP